MTNPTNSPAWQALSEHFQEIFPLQMRDMFAEDPKRFDKFSLKFNDFLLDYSKQRISEKTMTLLINLARQSDIEAWREKMFSGEKINFTENRAALHTALRNRSNKAVLVDGKDVMPEVNRVLAQIRTFSDSVRNGKWLGYSGKRITDIVNIGIGPNSLIINYNFSKSLIDI
jgi:glucose-6-phosphate isomerase